YRHSVPDVTGSKNNYRWLGPHYLYDHRAPLPLNSYLSENSPVATQDSLSGHLSKIIPQSLIYSRDHIHFRIVFGDQEPHRFSGTGQYCDDSEVDVPVIELLYIRQEVCSVQRSHRVYRVLKICFSGSRCFRLSAREVGERRFLLMNVTRGGGYF